MERNSSARHQVDKHGKEEIKNWRTVKEKSVHKREAWLLPFFAIRAKTQA